MYQSNLIELCFVCTSTYEKSMGCLSSISSHIWREKSCMFTMFDVSLINVYVFDIACIPISPLRYFLSFLKNKCCDYQTHTDDPYNLSFHNQILIG